MTRRTLLFVSMGLGLAALAPAAEPAKPKLVVGIVIDQFRYDYLMRFRPEYKGGLDRLMRNGALFTNARYRHYPTVTAVGHSTFMTGATPSISGIGENAWYDRESGEVVTSVSDPATRLLGGKDGVPGSSPRKLLVSTVGDELKTATRGQARVIGISIKDRAAILPSGHGANGAYWFDSDTGNFVSSTYYFETVPAWVKEFNGARVPDRYANTAWKASPASSGYAGFSKPMPAAGPALYRALEGSPYGDELIEAFAERAIEGEQLGRREVTDLLTVSFSSVDYVGHQYGPDSPEIRDMALGIDRTIGKLLAYLDQRIGLANTLLVLTGDHAVAPLPEAQAERKMPGGRLDAKQMQAALKNALDARFGAGDWVLSWAGTGPYLNRDLIRAKKLSEAEVEQAGAEALAALPHIYRVFTREQLLHGEIIPDPISAAVVRGYFPRRGADIIPVADPYWIEGAKGTSHGAPYGYDSHVPVLFLGPGVKPGRYNANIAPNDIAPTLATMLDIETPSGADGRVLEEMLTAETPRTPR